MNGSYGPMVGSVAMQQYYCKSSSDSGRRTSDGIVRAAFWQDRGCTNSSHGLMVGGIARRQYHHMGSLDSGR